MNENGRTVGTYRKYRDIGFKADTLKLLGQIDDIAQKYESAGYVLSVRQVYYQLVAGATIENTEASYNRIVNVVSNGRLAGLISWTAFEDRNRSLKGIRTYEGPGDAVRSTREEYHIDMWANQAVRPEVWVEKAALESVVGVMCNKLRVDFFAIRGYNSQSAQWQAGRRFAHYISKGQTPMVFHFGDHDPSGLDMTNDNRDRLAMFAGTPISVTRLALNWDQIKQYDPPPNPAKQTDSRYAVYAAQHGDQSWELDALRPEVVQGLIEDAVLRIRDADKWAEMVEQETEDLRVLDDAIEQMVGE